MRIIAEEDGMEEMSFLLRWELWDEVVAESWFEAELSSEFEEVLELTELLVELWLALELEDERRIDCCL